MGLPIIGDIVDGVFGVINKLVPDKAKAAEMQHEITKIMLSMDTGQLEINKEEAKHASIFVAGWRPFIGWVCGVALTWHFLGHDIAMWVQAGWFPDAPEPPKLTGTGELMSLVMALLGLGAMRSFEKYHGVSRISVGKQK